MKQILNKCNAKVHSDVNSSCEGKSKLLFFTKLVSYAYSPLTLVHTNLWGPSLIQYVNGYCFYIHFLDDYSKYSWVYHLKHRGEAVNAFNHFNARVENQFNIKINVIQCDNGADFKPFVSITQHAGIDMLYTCPYTSPQNSRAKRNHRHIVEIGLTLLA